MPSDEIDDYAALVNSHLGGGEERPPLPEVPRDGPVTLPMGFRRVSLEEPDGFVEVTTAWVRELNGYDEEAIAKAKMKGSQSAFIDSVVKAGTVKLGDEELTDLDLQDMLIGDRDFLLLEISRATYGDLLEYADYTCYRCGGLLDFTVDKGKDIPVRRGALEDREFDVLLRHGQKARVRLTNTSDLKATEKLDTVAAINSAILGRCVMEVKGREDMPAVIVEENPGIVKSLGLVDRQTILKEIAKRAPGPRYDEVTLTHPECGNEIKVVVTLGDMFRGL